ncbi:dehydratase [Lonepinella sp. MS14435]|uniref:ApeP family dehydratase n=1 Tax=Lonepinella sp. MS14435 TaxID=3003618 RepID=UPI0036DD724F
MIDLTCPINDVAPLIPQSGEMALLDCVTAFGADFLTAETVVKSDNIFVTQSKVASFVGLEILAQGIAAWAGCIALQKGEQVRLGYLLGSRKLSIYCDALPINQPLQIQVKLSLQDSMGFGVFDCQLIDLSNHQVLMEGALNVFSPYDEKEVV